MADFNFINVLKKREKFKQLNLAAKRVQQEKLKVEEDAKKGIKTKPTKPKEYTEAEQFVIARDYFISSGLDFKGQSQCCFEEVGGGVDIALSVDPGILTLGALSASVDVKVEGQVTQKTLLIVQVGPKAIGNYVVPCPYILNTCLGWRWEGAASVDVFAGVGVDAGISFDMAVAGKDFSSELTAEARVGVSASVGAGASHYYAEDYAPIVNSQRSDTLDSLLKFFQAKGSRKDYCKLMAKQLLGISGRKRIYMPIYGDPLLPSKKYISLLDLKIAAGGATSREEKAEATIIRNDLYRYKYKKINPIPNCIRITDYCGQAGVELTATASASANALGLIGASVEATAKSLANGKYKPVTVRFQSCYNAFEKDRDITVAQPLDYIVMTQDTRILYESYEMQLLSVEAKAEIKCSGEDSKPLVEGELTRETEKYLLNRMTYITTVIYWHTTMPLNLNKNEVTKEFTKRSLQGSGICFGGSYQLTDLARYSQESRALNLEKLMPLYTISSIANNDIPHAYPTKPDMEEGADYSGDEKAFEKHVRSDYDGTIEESEMPSQIRKALATYEQQTNDLFTSQSAGSTRAKGILKKMVDAKDPELGDTVAWLIGVKGPSPKIDTGQFHNETLNKVGGARGFFSQKSKGKTEGRLYGLLKTHYAIAIQLNDQEAKHFSQKVGEHNSEQERLSKLLQDKNEEIKIKNEKKREDHRASESAKTRRNFAKSSAFLEETERVRKLNKELDEKKRRIDEINNEIAKQNTILQAQNSEFNQKNTVNGFATFEIRERPYEKPDTEKLDFDDIMIENAKLIKVNEEIILTNAAELKKWNAENDYLGKLAANLHVTEIQLKDFFKSKDMIDWMGNVGDLLAMGETVLLESTFNQSDYDITLLSTRKKINGDEVLIELKPNIAKEMLESFEYKGSEARKLESIRMRWRIQDLLDDGSDLFKLGVKVFGNGVKINLKKVDQGGSEGIVDICMVFFGDLREVAEESNDYNPGRRASLDDAVPPTTLYCL